MTTTKKLPASTGAALEPDEVIDPTAYARDLTSTVGAAARFAFGRSVRENTGGVRDAALEYAGHLDEWPAFVREVFAALYDPDELRPLHPDEQSAFAVAAMRALEVQSSFVTLRESASAHRVIAAESSSRLSKVAAKAMGLDKMDADDVPSDDPRGVDEILDQLEDLMSDSGATEEQIADARTSAQVEAQRGQMVRNAMMSNLDQAMRSPQMAAAVAGIAADAKKKADAVSAARGFGLEGTSEDGDDGIDEELLSFLMGNPTLLAVLKECGRLRESASATGLAATVSGNCDVLGVVPGDDFARLTSHEIALLDDDDLGDHTIARVVDGDALCWELKGEERRDNGDKIIIVDRSGSMHGATIVFARALAAAALVDARRAKKRVVLCMFGSGPCTVVRVDAKHGIKDALRALGLPADGGTDTPSAYDAVMAEGFGDLRDPDVLLITDGGFPADDRLKKAVARFPDGTRQMALMLNATWGTAHDGWLDQKWEVKVSGGAGDSGTLVEIVNAMRGGKRASKKGGSR